MYFAKGECDVQTSLAGSEECTDKGCTCGVLQWHWYKIQHSVVRSYQQNRMQEKRVLRLSIVRVMFWLQVNCDGEMLEGRDFRFEVLHRRLQMVLPETAQDLVSPVVPWRLEHSNS